MSSTDGFRSSRTHKAKREWFTEFVAQKEGILEIAGCWNPELQKSVFIPVRDIECTWLAGVERRTCFCVAEPNAGSKEISHALGNWPAF